VPGLLFELRDEHGLEEKVSELFPERPVIVPVDRLEYLVGFLEHVWLEGVDRLLAIPRAAVGRAQPRDNLDEAKEGVGGGNLGHNDADYPMSELSFTSFVVSLASTAAIHFGDLADPVTGEKQPRNLEGASQMIEILTLLDQKTRGNLTAEERQVLEQVLYELRLRFVEIAGLDAAGNIPGKIITP
jgi:Domain of unknown function (DUF1844)